MAPRAALVVRDPPILKHTPVYRYNRFLRPYLEKGGADDLESMAVVRHPVSWLGSWYRYRSRDDLKGHPNSTANISFDTFVDEYTKGKPAPFAQVGSPSKFLRLGDGTIGVDHLFQYEQMDQALGFLEDVWAPKSPCRARTYHLRRSCPCPHGSKPSWNANVPIFTTCGKPGGAKRRARQSPPPPAPIETATCAAAPP